MIRIGRLETADQALLQRLAQLERKAFDAGGLNQWHLESLIGHGRVFTVRQNQEVVGLVQYMLDWTNPHKAYLIGVSISEEVRGQGLGTELIKKSFQALTGDNIEEVELTVDPANIAAIRVYEQKLGFIIKEERINEYGKDENRLVMSVSLEKFADDI